MSAKQQINQNPDDSEKKLQEENSDLINLEEKESKDSKKNSSKDVEEIPVKEKKPNPKGKKMENKSVEEKISGTEGEAKKKKKTKKESQSEIESKKDQSKKDEKVASKKKNNKPSISSDEVKTAVPPQDGELDKVTKTKVAEKKSETISDEQTESIANKEPADDSEKNEEKIVEDISSSKAAGELDKEIKTTKGKISESIPDEADNDDEDTHDDEDDSEHEEPVENYNTFSREELVNQLEEIINEGEVQTIKKKVALIKVAFIKLSKDEKQQKFDEFIAEGGDKNEYEIKEDPIQIRFNEIFSVYKDKRQRYIEELETIKKQNLDTKKIILEELKALIDSEESLKKTYDQFKVLQEKWKEVGMVPKNEVNNLWQSYHFFVEKFFDKVKINKELRDLDLKKNLELKIELCEKTEELLLETSILKSFKHLQKYHQQWKETGSVPQDKKDEIWERFKGATDKINQRRREHYEKLQEEQDNNLLAKTALCEKAEESLLIDNKTIRDWQNSTDQITELLKVWKTIGPAPRKQNDEIWERFKTSLDTFFSSKKEFFQKIKEEQLNNYNLKLDLCVQAEAIKTSTDWKPTTQNLIDLQKEWKTIGPVPRKHSDKIWKRFRAACDEFFNNKSDFYSNIEQHEADNLKLKSELIKKVEEFEFDDDKNKNLDQLKNFQREYTEIGHVPFKDKDRLQNEFRNVINSKLDKLKISKTVMQTINYKQKIEGMKDNPNSRRIISSEKNYLIGKQKKLEEEINLWENNIGFLAESKKASLLKVEFEKKINSAKGELEVLKAKLKLLSSEAR